MSFAAGVALALGSLALPLLALGYFVRRWLLVLVLGFVATTLTTLTLVGGTVDDHDGDWQTSELTPYIGALTFGAVLLVAAAVAAGQRR